MKIPDSNYCIPATINQYLGWADANDLHQFTFSPILTGLWLKSPEEASFVLRDLLSSFMKSEQLKQLFYATHKGLNNLLDEAFLKEKDTNVVTDYQALSIRAEIAISDDMYDTYYELVGVSEFDKKTCGRPETYSLDFEPLRNLLDFKVSFNTEVIISDMRSSIKSTYDYQNGFPNIRLIDVLSTIFDSLTFGGYSDEEKAKNRNDLFAILDERMSGPFLSQEEVMAELNGRFKSDS